MSEPKIINDFPGKAVEEYRRTHGGTLPGQEKLWLENLITAVKASAWPKITEVELDDLHKLALKGLEVDAARPEVETQERELIARNAINCALEEAAEVCMRHIEEAKEWGHFDAMRTAATLADLIRAIKSEPHMNNGSDKQ